MYKKSALIRSTAVIVLILFISCFSPFTSVAMQLSLSFDEVVKKADVIFLGTVIEQNSRYGPNRKMIFTDVSFEVKEIIYQSEKSQPIIGKEIMLTFAGGEVEGKRVKVSEVPSFETGTTYLIFSRIDGKTYASPIVGSFQGLFIVITDERSGISYPLTYGRKSIVEIRNGNLVTGPSVAEIRGGVMEGMSEKVPDRFYSVPPQPAGKMAQNAEAYVSTEAKGMLRENMPLDEFISEIRKKIK
jgi:hypothetical protein